jgi:hypothetical protein
MKFGNGWSLVWGLRVWIINFHPKDVDHQLPIYLIKFKPKNKAATVPATQISPLTIFCKT